MSFVPADFVPPAELATDQFRLVPLGVQHNEADLAAWTSSLDHIRSTPGFADHGWPRAPMTLAENRRDLEAHAADFAGRTGFTYTVLAAGTDEVIGCVYIYPARDADAAVRSWVRADRAALDTPLYAAVSAWLAAHWPFRHVGYAPRPA